MRLARVIREAAVEALFVKFARVRGWLATKFVSPNLRGVPDRMVLKGIDEAARYIQAHFDSAWPEEHARQILERCIEFVELKAPGQKPTLQQMRRHEQLRKLGFKVSIVDSPEAVKEWFDERD